MSNISVSRETPASKAEKSDSRESPRGEPERATIERAYTASNYLLTCVLVL